MTRLVRFFIYWAWLFLSIGCSKGVLPDYPQGTITTPRSDKIKTYLAHTLPRQTQGLSGIKSSDWEDNWGMLFFYSEPGYRQFWMPDTYFDLDIIFLSKDFKILHIERSVHAHPGRSESPPIPRTPTIHAWHVLELKSQSPIAKSLKLGDQLIWQGPAEQTLPNIHPEI